MRPITNPSAFLVAALFLVAGCGQPDNFKAISSQSSTDGSTDGGGSTTAPACTPTSTNTPIITTLPTGVSASTIASICPAVGHDSECGVVILISNSGVELYFTGQGPYDGADDTLVGVLNLSNTAISTLALSSNLDIMGFDGDGLDLYDIAGTTNKVGGNAKDTSGYGGPNAYFSNISSGHNSGTVNFITPVAPNGGTTYFGLENALTSTSACLNTIAQ